MLPLARRRIASAARVLRIRDTRGQAKRQGSEVPLSTSQSVSRVDFTPLLDQALIAALTALVAEGSAAICDIRSGCAAVRLKADNSPVTDADEAAEAVILKGLAMLMPGVPVISEEQASTREGARGAALFVLVDPLDGTREFVAGRDEFTVNLAIVADGVPVLGFIAAPALGLLWRGVASCGAQRMACNDPASAVPIASRAWPASGARALVSRSHLDAASMALLDRFGPLDRAPCGSSLKFCRLAEGTADIYPRLAPTSEWDIAAGHALLAAAGGAVTAPDGRALSYGMAADLRVPGFVACGDPAAHARLAH